MIKMLIGGSPCTHWSIAQSKNRETTAEGLGWELFRNFLIARDKYKPDYFLYENNKSMAPAIRAQITTEFGFEPILINSALMSAQNRQRLYWFGRRNVDGTYSKVDVTQPTDKGILLRDILETGIPWTEKGYCLTASYDGAVAWNTIERKQRTMVAEPVCITAKGKAHTLKAQYYKNGIANFVTNGGYPSTAVAEPVCVAQRGRYEDTGNRSKKGNGGVQQFYEAREDGKSNTLTTVQKDNAVAVPIDYCPLHSCDVVINDTNIRCAYKDGSGTAQGYTVYFDDVKSPAVIAGHAHKMKIIESVDGKTRPIRIGTIENTAKNPDHDSQQYRVYSPDAKSVTLCGNGGGLGAKTGLYAVPTQIEWHDGKNYPVYEVANGLITIKDKTYPIKLEDGYYIIRKLTVTECMRLQTVPARYEFPVSNTQAYKMLGNGWTVDVISHILSHAPGITTEPLEVLSMYDGMSCGRIALQNLGANVTRYYATEIDKYAVQTAQHNFPDTIQLGDAFQVREDGWGLGAAE